MKKKYLKPYIQAVAIDEQNSLLSVSNVKSHEEKGDSNQFSREVDNWDDEDF
jgi:hypothetical protein